MPEPDFQIKRGDTSSPLFVTLEDENGDAVDIENAVVRFRMGPIDGGDLVISDEAVNLQNGDGSDGTLGEVTYTWILQASEAGFYLGEMEVTYVSGDVQTFPNSGYILINVLEDL